MRGVVLAWLVAALAAAPVAGAEPRGGAPARKSPKLPMLRDPGAWNWVGGMFSALTRAAGLEPDVPSPERRARLAGWEEAMGKGPADEDLDELEDDESGADDGPEADGAGGRGKDPRPKAGEDQTRARTRRRDRLTLWILNLPLVNAFATATQKVIVTRGLLEFVRSDDELAGVIGHEIGHLKAGHPRKLAEKQTLLQVLGAIGGAAVGKGSGGPLAGAALGQLGSLGYNRSAELQADRIGMDLMKTCGYHPVGLLGFLTRLAEEHGIALNDPLSVWLSTHPPSGQRLSRIRRVVGAEKGLAAPGGLTYSFRQAIYSPKVTDSAAGLLFSTGPAVSLTAPASTTAVSLPSDPVPEPEPPLIVRLHGWGELRRGLPRVDGRTAPVPEGLRLSPGTLMAGTTFPLDPHASYMVATRVRSAGERARVFAGLELLASDDEVLGAVFPGAPGLFVGPEVVVLGGVTHPYDRLDAAGGKVPAAARLLVRAGSGTHGDLVVEELSLGSIGPSPATSK